MSERTNCGNDKLNEAIELLNASQKGREADGFTVEENVMRALRKALMYVRERMRNGYSEKTTYKETLPLLKSISEEYLKRFESNETPEYVIAEMTIKGLPSTIKSEYELERNITALMCVLIKCAESYHYDDAEYLKYISYTQEIELLNLTPNTIELGFVQVRSMTLEEEDRKYEAKYGRKPTVAERLRGRGCTIDEVLLHA